mgnify:CR=1 FL=1
MKYWFVIRRGSDGSYFYGCPVDELNEKEEGEALEFILSAVKKMGDELCLLIQMSGRLPIVNQVFPTEPTEESEKYLGWLLDELYRN